jgi:hypothetical protein
MALITKRVFAAQINNLLRKVSKTGSSANVAPQEQGGFRKLASGQSQGRDDQDPSDTAGKRRLNHSSGTFKIDD